MFGAEVGRVLTTAIVYLWSYGVICFEREKPSPALRGFELSNFSIIYIADWRGGQMNGAK